MAKIAISCLLCRRFKVVTTTIIHNVQQYKNILPEEQNYYIKPELQVFKSVAATLCNLEKAAVRTATY